MLKIFCKTVTFYFDYILLLLHFLCRYMAGQKEYEVELQFTSGILSYPSRTNLDEENIDGEEPIFGSRMDLKSASPSSTRRGSRISLMG